MTQIRLGSSQGNGETKPFFQLTETAFARLTSMRSINRRSFLTGSTLGVLASSLYGAAKSNLSAQQPTRQLDAYIRNKMTAHQIPGLALAVVREGGILILGNWGKHCLELDVDVTPRSVFQIFSVTKIFAGTCLAILLDEGKLSIDDPVSRHLDGLPKHWSSMRIKHLLSHTSGLRNYFENPKYQALGENKSADQVIAAIAEMPLRFSPGDAFSYEQSGNFMFSQILQKLSGISYEQFVRERIFRASGIDDAMFGGSKVIVKNRPPMSYNMAPAGMRHWEFPFTEVDYPSAGLNISVTGLAKFFAALQRGRLVSKSAADVIWASTILNDGRKVDYGQSWSREERAGRSIVGHEGGGCGWAEHDPERALSVAVICNLNGVRRDEIVKEVSEMFVS